MLCLCMLASVNGCSKEQEAKESNKTEITETETAETDKTEETLAEIDDETVISENPMDEVKNAYSEFLHDYAETHHTENWRYNVAYIDSDNVPELIISNNKQSGLSDKTVSIYSYYTNSKMVSRGNTFENWFYGDNIPDMDFNGIYYLVNENRIYVENYRITTFEGCSKVSGIFNMYGDPYMMLGYPEKPDGQYFISVVPENFGIWIDKSEAQSIVQKFNDEIRSYVPTNSLDAYAPYTYSYTLYIYDPDTVDAVLDDICVEPEFVAEYTVPQPTEVFVMEELKAADEESAPEEALPVEEITIEYPDWRSAYVGLLTEHLTCEYCLTHEAKFSLAYLDEDDIPELLLTTRYYFYWNTEIYSYDGYKAERIDYMKGGSCSELPCLLYTPYKNDFIECYIFDEFGCSKDSTKYSYLCRSVGSTLCRLENKELKKLKSFDYYVMEDYEGKYQDWHDYSIRENDTTGYVNRDEFYNELASIATQTAKVIFYDLNEEEIAKLDTDKRTFYTEVESIAAYVKRFDIDFPKEAPLCEKVQLADLFTSLTDETAQ